MYNSRFSSRMRHLMQLSLLPILVVSLYFVSSASQDQFNSNEEDLSLFAERAVRAEVLDQKITDWLENSPDVQNIVVSEWEAVKLDKDALQLPEEVSQVPKDVAKLYTKRRVTFRASDGLQYFFLKAGIVKGLSSSSIVWAGKVSNDSGLVVGKGILHVYADRIQGNIQVGDRVYYLSQLPESDYHVLYEVELPKRQVRKDDVTDTRTEQERHASKERVREFLTRPDIVEKRRQRDARVLEEVRLHELKMEEERNEGGK